MEEKQKCNIQQNNRGWSGMHSEILDPKTQKVGDYKEYVIWHLLMNGSD